MVAGCAAGEEASGLWVPSLLEKREAPVVLEQIECLLSEGERPCIELYLFRMEKFEFSGMSRIRIRPGCGKIRKQISSRSIRYKIIGTTS